MNDQTRISSEILFEKCPRDMLSAMAVLRQ